jgi:hypothetical protein
MAGIPEKRCCIDVSGLVFGEPGLAEKGLLVCVPVGEPEDVKKVLPYTTGVYVLVFVWGYIYILTCHSVGRAVIDLSGEPLHKATLLKLIGNVFIIAMMETVAEGHVMAEKTGLGHGPLQQMIKAIFPSPCAIYSDRMVSGGYYKDAVSQFHGLISGSILIRSKTANCRD